MKPISVGSLVRAAVVEPPPLEPRAAEIAAVRADAGLAARGRAAEPAPKRDTGITVAQALAAPRRTVAAAKSVSAAHQARLMDVLAEIIVANGFGAMMQLTQQTQKKLAKACRDQNGNIEGWIV